MLFIFSMPGLIRHLWQLKTAIFLHWCLICAVLFSWLHIYCETVFMELFKLYICVLFTILAIASYSLLVPKRVVVTVASALGTLGYFVTLITKQC